ncbi:recombinase family protein [Sporolactobacillus terrae]|uniref:recombinase family protein n=1 Tax=Sporolactobacillus terrae TaxID=269673 RepID=UPI00048EB5F6|nr:recombinase family protein [Sporolactobacillus terrae]
MIYGYVRVFLQSQSLEKQYQVLHSAGCTEIFLDRTSELKQDLPNFKILLSRLKSGDSLVVPKLDSFARSYSEAMTIVSNLFHTQVTVNILNMGIMDSTPDGEHIFKIFCAFTRAERDFVITRTQEGKEQARKHEGFREGRPRKFNDQQIEYALSLLTFSSFGEVAEITGISESTLARYKRKSLSKMRN